MISISNADRDKIVEFLRMLAAELQERPTQSLRRRNARRTALLLASKLEIKKSFPKPGKDDNRNQEEMNKTK